MFGVAETGGEVQSVQISGQRASTCATLENRGLTVRKNCDHSGTREADFQSIEDGRGRPGDAFVRIEIGPVGRRETVRGEPDRLAASPRTQDRNADASPGRFACREMLPGAFERAGVLNGVCHRALLLAQDRVVSSLVIGVVFILIVSSG
ncbi:hypothetical protein, partial [Frankia sp. Cr1]|uniref:hypothetical protein n=1 Tax=Frankia sp. Cr1 TaxID=3073931 RepID=UPI002AD30E78